MQLPGFKELASLLIPALPHRCQAYVVVDHFAIVLPPVTIMCKHTFPNRLVTQPQSYVCGISRIIGIPPEKVDE